jgi:hypothetical protein
VAAGAAHALLSFITNANVDADVGVTLAMAPANREAPFFLGGTMSDPTQAFEARARAR